MGSKKSKRLLGIVECHKVVYEAASKSSSVINFKRCHIDYSVQVMRCKTCQVDGYTKNHFPGEVENMLKEEKEKTCINRVYITLN